MSELSAAFLEIARRAPVSEVAVQTQSAPMFMRWCERCQHHTMHLLTPAGSECDCGYVNEKFKVEGGREQVR